MSRRRRRNMKDLSIAFDKTQYVEKELIDIVTLWMLRAIVKADGFKEFLDKNNNFNDESVAYFLGLGDYVEMGKEAFSRKEVYALLNEKLEKLEKQKHFSIFPILQHNLERLSRLVGLNKTETEILKLATLIKNYKLLNIVLEYMGTELTIKQTKQALAVILDIDYKKIDEALSYSSVLVASSLINIQTKRWSTGALKQKLELPTESFSEFLFYSDDEDITLAFKDSVRQLEKGLLTLKDYDYIQKDINMLKDYLKDVLKQKREGVNILLYGVPGTGKTELAKTVAKTLKSELYEVSYINEHNEASDIGERLNAYKNAQVLLKDRRVMLMYDEAEDIFDTYNGFFSQKKQESKAWVNHMLESNSIPTVWITNDIDSVDPAIVRRFDMAMEMKVPKKKKRIEILKRYSNGLLEEKMVKKLAKNPYISPAVMQRAIKVAEQTQTKHFSKTVYRLIDKTLKAQRYPGLKAMKEKKKKNKQDALPKTYDPMLVNADADLEKLAEGIAKTENARLCFYGVPGTGKSAYGRYIAKTLGRKVIVKKGSDLLSMWVGGTEQNIAAAFAEAKKKKAVLIFDEVDSFLQDRQNAQRSWEVTQVNEMLTQMESFEGVFIATTNLMENLDRASLRRFDMKLEFKALKDMQAQKLLESHCRALKIDFKKKDITQQLHLDSLTPGDFAAVARQHRFNPIESLEDFVQRLKEEVRIKRVEDGEKKMGFI